MKKQEHVAFQVSFLEMTKEEIVAHFSRYDFIDENGHRLEFCDDFLDLVGLVCCNKPM